MRLLKYRLASQGQKIYSEDIGNVSYGVRQGRVLHGNNNKTSSTKDGLVKTLQNGLKLKYPVQLYVV